ncbi:MAG: hypothetical protein M3Q74_12860, partial [Pseudomonadota bacterium]|nr:hypothetical protein [Pseudomonadota bacterium]
PRETPQDAAVEPSEVVAPVPTAEPAQSEAVAEAPVTDIPATDAPKARRTRSRRGARPAATEAVEVAEAPFARPIAAAAPAPEAPTPATTPQDRPVQETHLRHSDRRGDNASPEPQRSNGRPFGEGDVPAFLRRPVSIKG